MDNSTMFDLKNPLDIAKDPIGVSQEQEQNTQLDDIINKPPTKGRKKVKVKNVSVKDSLLQPPVIEKNTKDLSKSEDPFDKALAYLAVKNAQKDREDVKNFYDKHYGKEVSIDRSGKNVFKEMNMERPNVGTYDIPKDLIDDVYKYGQEVNQFDDYESINDKIKKGEDAYSLTSFDSKSAGMKYLKNFGKESFRGIYEAAAGIVDTIPAIWSWYTGSENTRWTPEMSDTTEKVYNTNAVGDAAVTTAFSLGLLGEGIAESIATAYVTGGLGSGLAATRLGAKFAMLGKYSKAVLAGSGFIGNQAWQGFRNAAMNSRDGANEVKEFYEAQRKREIEEKGFSDITDEFIKERMGESYRTTMNRQAVPLMVLNVMQGMLIMKAFRAAFKGASSVANNADDALASTGNYLLRRNVLNKTARIGNVSNSIEEGANELLGINNIQNAIYRRPLKLATLMASEGGEEYFEEWSIRQGVEKATGLIQDYNDDRGMEALMAGAIAGGVLGAFSTSMMKAIQKRAQKGKEKRFTKFYSDIVNQEVKNFENYQKTAYMHGMAQKAYEANPTEDNEAVVAHFEQQLDDILERSSMYNHMLAIGSDLSNGEGSKYEDAMIQHYQELVDAVRNKDVAKLQQMNLVDENGEELQEGLLERVANNYEKLLSRKDEYRDFMYDVMENHTNGNIYMAAMVANKKWFIDNLENKFKQGDVDTQRFLNTDDFTTLSPALQQRIKDFDGTEDVNTGFLNKLTQEEIEEISEIKGKDNKLFSSIVEAVKAKGYRKSFEAKLNKLKADYEEFIKPENIIKTYRKLQLEHKKAKKGDITSEEDKEEVRQGIKQVMEDFKKELEDSMTNKEEENNKVQDPGNTNKKVTVTEDLVKQKAKDKAKDNLTYQRFLENMSAFLEDIEGKEIEESVLDEDIESEIREIKNGLRNTNPAVNSLNDPSVPNVNNTGKEGAFDSNHVQEKSQLFDSIEAEDNLKSLIGEEKALTTSILKVFNSLVKEVNNNVVENVSLHFDNKKVSISFTDKNGRSVNNVKVDNKILKQLDKSLKYLKDKLEKNNVVINSVDIENGKLEIKTKSFIEPNGENEVIVGKEGDVRINKAKNDPINNVILDPTIAPSIYSENADATVIPNKQIHPVIREFMKELSYAADEYRNINQSTEQVPVEKMYEMFGNIYGYPRLVVHFNRITEALRAMGYDISEETKATFYEQYYTPEREYLGTFRNQGVAQAPATVITKFNEEAPSQKESTSSTEIIGEHKVLETVEEDGKTLDPLLKAGHRHIDFEVKEVEGERIVVEKTDALSTNKNIGNHLILDPDLIKEGEELSVTIAPNALELEVSDIDGKQILFKDWMKKYDVQEGTEAYYNKVPLIATKNIGGTDKIIFYLHDADWYNKKNISLRYGTQVQEEVIRLGRQNIINARQSLVGKNGVGGKIVISRRTFGHFVNLNRNGVDNSEPLAKANGGKIEIGVIGADGKIYTADNNSGNQIDDVTLAFRKEADANFSGAVVEMRETSNGKKVAFVARANNPVNGELLDDTTYNTIKYGILAYIWQNGDSDVRLNLEKNYGITEEKVKNISKLFYDNQLPDPTKEPVEFMSMFAHVMERDSDFQHVITDKTTVNGDGSLRYPYNQIYVSYDEKWKQLKIHYKADGRNIDPSKVGGIPIGTNMTMKHYSAIEELLSLNFFGDNGVIRNMKLSPSKNYVSNKDRKTHKGSKLSMVVMDKEGNAKTYQTENSNSNNDYSGFVIDRLKSNVKSYEIDTFDSEGKPTKKWVIDVQPKLNYEVKETNSGTLPKIETIDLSNFEKPDPTTGQVSKVNPKSIQVKEATKTDNGRANTLFEAIASLTDEESFNDLKIKVEKRNSEEGLSFVLKTEEETGQGISQERFIDLDKEFFNKHILGNLDYKSKEKVGKSTSFTLYSITIGNDGNITIKGKANFDNNASEDVELTYKETPEIIRKKYGQEYKIDGNSFFYNHTEGKFFKETEKGFEEVTNEKEQNKILVEHVKKNPNDFKVVNVGNTDFIIANGRVINLKTGNTIKDKKIIKKIEEKTTEKRKEEEQQKKDLTKRKSAYIDPTSLTLEQKQMLVNEYDKLIEQEMSKDNPDEDLIGILRRKKANVLAGVIYEEKGLVPVRGRDVDPDEVLEDTFEEEEDDTLDKETIDARDLQLQSLYSNSRMPTSQELDLLWTVTTNMIDGFNLETQKMLINTLISRIKKRYLDEKNVRINLKGMLANLRQDTLDILEQIILEKEEDIHKLEQIEEVDSSVINNSIKEGKKLVRMFKNAQEQVHKLIGDDINEGALTKAIRIFFGREFKALMSESNDGVHIAASENLDTNLDNNSDEAEKSYSKTAFETDILTSFSTKLKLMFSDLPMTDSNGKVILDKLGMPIYLDLNSAISLAKEVTTRVDSDINEVIEALESKGGNYAKIAEKLKGMTEQMKNEFLYKMSQSKLNMYFLLHKVDAMGNTSLKIMNANSNKIDIEIFTDFKNKFYSNEDLFFVEDGEVKYNTETIDKYLEVTKILMNNSQLNKEGEEKTKLVAAITEFLNGLGIEVSANTIEELYDSKEFKLVGQASLFNYLNAAFITAKKEGILTEKNDIFKKITQSIRKMVEKEVELNDLSVDSSFRVGEKTIQGTVQKMVSYQNIAKLKEGYYDEEGNYHNEFIEKLLKTPYSRNNYLIHMLMTNPKISRELGVDFVSLESMIDEVVKITNLDKLKVDQLSKSDALTLQLGFFSALNNAYTSDLYGNNIEFRTVKMFNPAISDKGQMLVYNVPTLNITGRHIEYEIAGSIGLKDDVLEFIAEQVVGSEFDRIIQTYRNSTNIKGYNEAAKYFTSIVGLNNIEVEFRGKLYNVHDVIKKANGKDGLVLALREKVLKASKKVIMDYLNYEMTKKIDIANKTGEFYDYGFIDANSKAKKVSSLYLEKNRATNEFEGTDLKSLQLLALNFVTAQFLHNETLNRTITGDPALYAPSSSKYTKKTESGEKVVDYYKLVKLIGMNNTKRQAMFIAPGNLLANSKGDKYIQIFLNDPVSVSEVSASYIRQFYGHVSDENKAALNELNTVDLAINQINRDNYNNPNLVESLINHKEGNNPSLLERREAAIKTLKRLNPEIEGYFEIEGTDAQEYTTWKEHMDVIWRQGRLSENEKKIYQSAYEKLSAWDNLKEEDILLPENQLNKEELKFVMQPIKPVYTGNNFDTDGVNRIIYIKSSSFPLLPQITAGQKIDKIRIALERVQAVEGKNVRISYQTANKVGAISSGLTVDHFYNNSVNTLYNENGEGMLKESMMTLDREYFRIQQDVPYHTEEALAHGMEDYIRMGYQIWKLILSNDVAHNKNSIFPNLFSPDFLKSLGYELKNSDRQFITGEELAEIKKTLDHRYTSLLREKLLSNLGIDSKTLKMSDPEKSYDKLSQILKEEIESRDLPEDLLEVIEVIQEGGKSFFNSPIWLSTYSNKFEQVLMAIVNNRMTKLKLPGNAHVVGSSEGFEFVGINELSDSIKSRVVWLDTSRRGQLKGTHFDFKFIPNENVAKRIEEGKNAIAEAAERVDSIDILRKNKKGNKFSSIKGKDIDEFRKVLESLKGEKNKLSKLEELGYYVSDENRDDFESYLKNDLDKYLYRTDVDEAKANYENAILEEAERNNQGRTEKKLKESEILIQSKFRVQKEDGSYELIDLTDEKYSYIDEDGYRVLRTDMIDPELLQHFSFRIPTSSHQSGAIVRVVGFLPEEAGDLVVVPKEHTKQFGEDFDVDKRMIYKLNYFINKQGQIKKINYNDYSNLFYDLEVVNTLKNEINELTEEIEELRERRDIHEGNIKDVKDELSEEEEGSIKNDIIDLLLTFEEGTKDNIEEAVDKFANYSKSIQENYESNFMRVNEILRELNLDKKQLKTLRSNLRAIIHSGDNVVLKGRKSPTKRAIEAFELKVLENEMINIYKSVYLNTDTNLQRKINQILSFEQAQQAVDIISDAVNTDNDNDWAKDNFSLNSDSYQRDQMKSGASGKTATAIHSSAVVLQAILERLPAKKKVGFDRTINIGGLISSGKLGLTNDLSGTTTISNFNAENQNSAVDNVKAGVMYLRNENIYTINAFIHFGRRGFVNAEFYYTKLKDGSVHIFRDEYTTDAEGKRVLVKKASTLQKEFEQGKDVEISTTHINLPSLLISQPIIKEYVRLMEQNNSVIEDKNTTKADIVHKLFAEQFALLGDEHEIVKNYREVKGNANKIDEKNVLKRAKGENESEETYNPDTLLNEYTAKLTADELYSNLTRESAETQVAVLKLFLMMEKENNALTSFTNMMNLSDGLGISYFNTIDVLDKLNSIDENNIYNIRELIGEFVKAEDFPSFIADKIHTETDPFDNQAIYEGYYNIGDYYVKPTTSEGMHLIQTVTTSKALMEKVFPYEDEKIQNIVNTIIEQSSGEDFGKQKIKHKYEIINELRDFVYSSSPLFKKDSDIESVKKSMFFDTADNTSLANILRKIKKSNNPKLISLFERNELLKNLKFSVFLNGKPSLITYNKQNSYVDVNEKMKDSFYSLLHDNTTYLGTFNGIPYTPRLIAQQLAEYAMFARNSEAIGIRKFIPQKYFTAMGVNENLRKAMDKIEPEVFIRQYFQHNPHKTTRIMRLDSKLEEYGLKSVKRDGSFEYVSFKDLDRFPDPVQPDSIESVKIRKGVDTQDMPKYAYIVNTNEKSPDRYVLFELREEEGIYKRIDTLGYFGFNDYNMDIADKRSVTTDLRATSGMNKVRRLLNVKEVEGKSVLRYLHETQSAVNLLDNLIASGNFKHEAIAKKLMPFIEEKKVKVVVRDATREYTDANGNKLIKRYPAYYDKVNREVVIDRFAFNSKPDNISPMEYISNLVMEEVIHAVTVHDMAEHIEMNTQTGIAYLKDPSNAPLYARNLVTLYNEAKGSDELKGHYYMSNIDEFVAGAMMSDEFKDKLNNAKVGKETLWKRFVKAIVNALRYITGSTYSEVTENAVFDMLSKKTDDEIENRNLIENAHLMDSKKDVETLKEVENMTNADYLLYLQSEKDFKDLYNQLIEIGADTEDQFEALLSKGLITKECK